MSTEQMRQEFEEAVLRDWPGANLNTCDVPFSLRAGQYVDECVQRAWWGWQASRAAIVVQLPQGGYWAGYDNEHMMESRDVREAVEAVGLKVKP